MNDNRHVVVIDGLPETEAVLKAVLEPRGFAVSRVRSEFLRDFEPAQRPELVVQHGELPGAGAPWNDVPRVVIGTVELAAHDARSSNLPPLFQYADLIRAVDRLLPARAAEASPRDRRAA